MLFMLCPNSPLWASRQSHEQMMPAGRGDLQRAFCAFLALDVAQIEMRRFRLVHLRCGRDSTCVPLKWLAIWISDFAAMIWISGLAQAASVPHAAGQIRPSSREFAPIAAGNTPATARSSHRARARRAP